jgi:hypothetical protein
MMIAKTTPAMTSNDTILSNELALNFRFLPEIDDIGVLLGLKLALSVDAIPPEVLTPNPGR